MVGVRAFIVLRVTDLVDLQQLTLFRHKPHAPLLPFKRGIWWFQDSRSWEILQRSARHWLKFKPDLRLRKAMDALKQVQRYGGPQVQFGNILRDLKQVGVELARKKKMLRVV